MYYPFASTLENLKHSDIVAFCNQGVSENIYLDYKQEIKADKLSQSVASFANTKGGILLIGVSEDKTTKLPDKTEGITDNGTLSETINQIIANVTPFPTCRFAIIPHKNKGKAFVIILVEEGASAPYFTVHKPVVYVRTGDISTPISESNRADLLALTERGEVADAKIQSSLNLATEIFDERYKRARDSAKAEQRQKNPPSQMERLMDTSYVDDMYGYTAPITISSVIPNNPDELADHKVLLDEQMDFRFNKGSHTVPTSMLDPVRYGIATRNEQAFNIDRKVVRYAYVNKYGLIQLRTELNDAHNGAEYHNLFRALWTVADTLRYASTYYSHFKYAGLLRLNVQLENLDKELMLLGSANIMFDEGILPVDLTSYEWTVELSTHDLTTDTAKLILTKLFTDIYLDLGFSDIAPEARDYIKGLVL